MAIGHFDGTQFDYYYGNDYGNYQFVSLEDIINQFMIIYTGSGKVINKTSRTDVAFFAQRGLAEMSFDTFKCVKSQEVDIPASLWNLSFTTSSRCELVFLRRGTVVEGRLIASLSDSFLARDGPTAL